jgi:hypothetical protein
VAARVQQQVEDAFRRLYRQRNLVVHAGHTTSVAGDGCLRTAAPLVGAGIDRLVSAAALHGTPPLTVAVRAELALASVHRAGARLADLIA